MTSPAWRELPAAVPDASLLELANAVLRRWRFVVALPLGCAVVGIGLALALPPWYAATAAFVPEARKGNLPSAVTSLAGQFGVALGDQGSQSPNFYAEVVQSRELMERILRDRYPRPKGSARDSVTLLDFLRADGATERARVEDGVRMLRKALVVTVDQQTTIVRVRVELREPVIAAEVANRLLAEVDAFNQGTRRSQARARRLFIQQRIGDAQSDLQRAEDTLQAWLTRNRTFQGWPELEFQHERMVRRVQLRQEVYLNLYREFESARIEEVNDTPVITIVDRAVAPARKSRPGRVVLVALFLVAGGLAGILGAIGQEYLGRLRAADATGYAEFRQLLAALGQDLRRARIRRRSRTF